MPVRTGLIAGILLLGTVPQSAHARFPGTLNFSNVTSTRIVQTVAETANNEKEVEYGDFDNDNDLDVVVAVAFSDFGQRKNKLYRNDAGVFNEISATAFITGAGYGPGFDSPDVTRNAFFRDYDRDGWLDIITINDKNTDGDPGRSKIYMNQHPGNVFAGFREEGAGPVNRLGNSTGGAACGAFSIDNDRDNDVDLYVGNYPGPSQDTLYFNDGNGFFTNMTGTHVPNDGAYTVDVSSADMNGDGRMDMLISNFTSDTNFVYYNNRNNAAGADGDYKYPGSTQTLGPAGLGENSMEPADFDNDGDQDVYWSDGAVGSSEDRIMQNTGNDGGGKAVFASVTGLPASLSIVSRKATVSDLNQDGRIDVLVMKEAGSASRPTLLRNTTVNGQITFVDWTPATAFPNGETHKGWHTAAFDSDGDGFEDLFLGGWTNDHLFLNTDSNEADEADLPGGGVKDLPDVYNAAPVAVRGTLSVGDSDTYEAADIASGAFISVVTNGCGDFDAELLDLGNGVLFTSDRGGIGVEEAFQQNATGGRRVRVSLNDLGADSDHDGSLTLRDFAGFQNSLGCAILGCRVFDCNADGEVDLIDLRALVEGLSGPSRPATIAYYLEILSRN